MPQQEVQSFLEKAESRLAGIRGSLLLFAQGRLGGTEIMPACEKLAQFQFEAEGAGLADIGRLAAEAAYSVEHLARGSAADRTATTNKTLDLISDLEAGLLDIPLDSDEFAAGVNELLESSFGEIDRQAPQASNELEGFEIDEETLEIFREEADGLIAGITAAIDRLRSAPRDNEALWEIRRNAHTLKGAAGIVGLESVSALAHVVEDLLDKMVSAERVVDERIVAALSSAADDLVAMSAGREPNATPSVVTELVAIRDDRTDSKELLSPDVSQPSQAIHTPPTPVVRVSLDRLDALLELSAKLISDNARLSRQMGDTVDRSVSELLSEQRDLSIAIRDGLQQIRMVRFGVLEMRLNRAVHVTCQDEQKSASVVLLDPDVEVDTLVIDALIEPLLHLMKNAVVHGIEPPETRRLLGKAEKGTISIGIASDNENITLSVEDDGRGVSAPQLIEKALENGLLTPEAARGIRSEDAYELIFERGLTTAGSLNMNAGRGVGMSIVKESVESRGGRIRIESEPQKGTKFTLTFPLKPQAAEPEPTVPLVLVVDDSGSIRRMTSKIIERSGSRAVTANDGAEALELLLSGSVRPDLILSDVEMPVMDGLQFLENVKADERHRHVPVVMVTSLSSNEYREKAAALGAADYVVKPFSIDDFERVIAPLMEAAR